MKRNYATQWIEQLRTPVKLSDHIQWIETTKLRRFVVFGRVSTNGQKATRNSENQISKLIKKVENRGIEVVGYFTEKARGEVEMYDEYSTGRTDLFKAISLAKRMRCGILAETVCRVRRGWMSKENRRKYRQRPLNIFEVETLMEEFDGVPLVTIVHPDMPPDEGGTRSCQTKRGQSEKGRKGGRPRIKTPIKNQRLKNIDRAIAMRDEGKSWGAISKALGVSRSTIRGWMPRRNPHT